MTRSSQRPLRIRWLGRVPYGEAWALQRGLHRGSLPGGPAEGEDRLLLLEHDHVYTLGRNGDEAHVLVDPDIVGAELIRVDRGGDVTYHGPGQLVAYPLVELSDRRGRRVSDGAVADVPRWVELLEQVVIDTLGAFGLRSAGRRTGYPGVWIDAGTVRARKIAAVGVRVEHGRTLHGVALNVDPDLSMFEHIVPCGIAELGVTSMSAEGVEATMQGVVAAFVESFVRLHRPSEVTRSDVVWRRPSTADGDLSPFSRGEGPGSPAGGSNGRQRSSVISERSAAATSERAAATSVRLRGRMAEAGVGSGVGIAERKPEWMRVPVHHDPAVLRTRRTVTDLGLVTVCEEAGCPNLSECWSDGTATFMINGERCTRACGFCLVDTRHPEPPSADEPGRVAEAVARMGLDYAVVTTVARDDLSDDGAGQMAETIRAIRARCPATSVEVLISDCRGHADSLRVIFDERPDVLNHNMETVARLQRVVRPSAGYARSLSVLARAREVDLVTKSGLVLGMGETVEEIGETLSDMAAVGVSIVTMGQYLRPTTHHLPVANWWAPQDFEMFAEMARRAGIASVESSPFTRSSYHARAAAAEARG